jgi:hypothetical protein
MNSAELTAILENCIAFMLFIVLLLELWPAHRVDRFRQDMFSIRDELFDYAASGAIEFSDPAYRLLRQSMNGFIRYAHRLTLFQVLLTMSIWRLWGSTPERTWAMEFGKAVANVRNEEARERISQLHERALSLVFGRLVLGSPILMVVFAVGLLCGAAKARVRAVRQRAREYAIYSVSKLVDPQLIEEAASRLAA